MKKIKKLATVLIQPFQSGNGFDIKLILVFLILNGIVLVNACLHDPRFGYDASEHLKYIKILSQLRLPTLQETEQFFAPPLSYAFPAILIALTGMEVFWAAKLAQFMNFFLSVGLTWYLIKTCQLINLQSSLKLGALVFLGILTVYYKTFAFIRGEPYVAFFAVVIMYYTLLMSIRERFTATNAAILGGAMGLCALSRQWGILLFPAVVLYLFFKWISLPQNRAQITKTLCLCLVITFLISGWFYISLHVKHGSGTAFNRKPAAQFSFRNQPLDFYVGLSPRLLFNNPIVPNFPNQFLPIFYSELWGDYWGLFTIYGRHTEWNTFIDADSLLQIFSLDINLSRIETNYKSFGAYLGRVNLISTFPSALALVSLVIALMGILRGHGNNQLKARQREIYSFLLLAICTTMVGYFWFLIMYPNIEQGDTIKATYVLQIFPFIAILVGIFIGKIKKRSRFLYRLILGGLCFVFFHNIFAMITNYTTIQAP
jgi:hypothetical protein